MEPCWEGVLSSIADLLRAFPDDMVLVCEAHARGLPEEHSAAYAATKGTWGPGFAVPASGSTILGFS